MTPLSLDTAAKALAFVSPVDRDDWIRMGMALKAEFGDDARDVWMDWSQGADTFERGAALASWKSFKLSGKVGIGSLIAEAKRRGFVLSEPDVPMTAEQLAAEKKAREERAAKAERDRIARAEAAARRAQSQWRMASPEGVSPYLERKLVVAEACRFLPDGSVIVPMMRYDAEPARMVGKQQIAPDGSKKYSGGMDKQGAACRLGELPADGDVLLVGEGFATGLSVRMAVAHQVPFFVAFDAVGLLHVARILRAKYPASPILFCADDDYLTGNKGFEKARAAADEIGNANVLLPVFTVPRRAEKADESLPSLTDFNDLHMAESLAAVSEQLAAAVESLRVTPSGPSDLPAGADALPRTPADDESEPAPKPGTIESMLQHFALVYGKTDVWDSLNRQLLKKSAFIACFGKEKATEWMAHPARKVIDPRDLPPLKAGRAFDGGGAGGGGTLDDLHRRFVLLFGTETVWDRQLRDVMGLSALRAAYPVLAPLWLESPHREMRDARNLVFDPTQQASPDTHINMFGGLPLTPVRDDEAVEYVLTLLESLCSAESNAEEVFDWLLKWLAYPLQNPGAKMQTAVLMFGEKQGTGKSLFFEGVMRPIYGEYGATAGQHQLESQFTDWKSRKLFVLFEEVLSRSDRYNHLGTLKHMVTGRDQRINPKGLPERVEANHLNAVFLSNEPQPIPIDLEDRRFLVVGAKKKLEKSFYDHFKVLLKKGASAAFYDFLLRYPLQDFNEHTQPPRTDSKDGIIRFGLPGWHVFHEKWKAGELSVPYVSCISEDLYAYFLRWCERTRENKLTLTKFSELMGGREHKARKRVSVTAGGTRAMRTVFVIEDPQGRSLDLQCEEFAKKLGAA